MSLYDLIMSRRSVRNFKKDKIPEDVIEKLLDAANNAPSGGNIQPISVILVEEEKNRNELAKIVGGRQPWVKNAPLSMIFCLDFYRVKKWASLMETHFKAQEALAHCLIGYADLICSSQNVVLMAEDLGLGSVYIGTIQNNMDGARQFFKIPEHVLPLMVLCVGYPKSIPQNIPKLSRRVISHRERYHIPKDEDIKAAFEEKYGLMDDNVEKYFQKAFIEILEADKQVTQDKIAETKKKMESLEVRNNAQFLFKVRYPAEVMVKLNEQIICSVKNAGFNFFNSPNNSRRQP